MAAPLRRPAASIRKRPRHAGTPDDEGGSSSGAGARPGAGSCSGGVGAELPDGAFVRALSTDVARGELSAACAERYLRALDQDMPKFSYGVKSAGECLDAMTGSLAWQQRDVPALLLIADASDWGKTGSRSTRDDLFAAFSLGPARKHLGVTLSYSLDGPDSDDDDSDGMASDAVNKESFHARVVVLPRGAVDDVWSAPSGGGMFDDGTKDALSRAIGDAYESELVSLDLASPGDGEVSAYKFDREAGRRLVEASGLSISFDAVVAEAIKVLARRGKYLKPLRKVFGRKSGVPELVKPLFEAFRSLK